MNTVLLVDDSPALQTLIGSTLQLIGVDVVCVSSAEQAQEQLRHRRFDLLLVDLDLPQGEAMQLLTRVRQRFASPQLPAVLLSGGGHLPEIGRVAQLGVDACLVKSAVCMRELMRTVQDLLAPRPRTAAA